MENNAVKYKIIVDSVDGKSHHEMTAIIPKTVCDDFILQFLEWETNWFANTKTHKHFEKSKEEFTHPQ